MSATPLVIWLPEPIATARRERFSAGTSLTPSPIIAVNRPRSARADTSACFCSGVIRQKTVFSSAARAMPVLSSGRSGPSIDAGVRGDAHRLGHRGHGLARVAGDQLQVHLLLAHELHGLRARRGRSCSSRTMSARGLQRRRRLVGRVVGQRAAGLAERDDAAPGAGVLAELLGEPRGQLERPRPAEDVRGAHHVAARRRPAVQRRAAPLPCGGEGDLGGHGHRRRDEALRDRLERPVALAGRVREPPKRLLGGLGIVGVRGLDRDELERAVGERPGLVHADRVDRRQRLGGADLLDERVLIFARRTAATARVTHIRRTSPSGTIVTRPAVAVCAASVMPTLRAFSASSRIAPSGIITAVVALRTRLTSICSGESGWRNAWASPASFSA